MNLKNGVEELDVLVSVTMLSLEKLIEKEPIAFYELNEIAKDPGHKIFGTCNEPLEALSLIGPGGQMHDSIRNIVLSAVVGEGFDLQLVNPKA